MTPRQVNLVQQTFAMVAPIAEQAAGLFYDRLFTLDPSLRPMFRGDMTHQGKKLISTLAIAVNGLKRPEKIVPAVRHLGRKHAGYGVRPEFYAVVGEALLWTLERGLGDAFTLEAEEAWTAAFKLLATVMQEAAAAEELELVDACIHINNAHDGARARPGTSENGVYCFS